ncbi:MAG TPA: ribonuclease J [Anaerolineaceae bacterium]|nr:ribonuclease J [Anaerolineaceae bacterium]HPN53115.1 ribonuclease J [Anaerolineaceae bacterium]
MNKDKMRIIPLGGLGEVGKNMMVYEYEDDILIVDTGMMFPESDMLGVDYIIPDFNYLMDKINRVRGIVLTHGHEDHVGALSHVLESINAPIYATPLTRGLAEVKLARAGLLQKADLRTVQAGDTVQIASFKVDFFHVCHSIPDGVGLGIETPAGLVVHSGDYKFDHTPVDNWPSDYARLASFSRRGVLALLSDSTNAERAGWTPSEKVIDSALDMVFRKAPGRIIIATFASLISRMQQAANAAIHYGRKLAFVGPSMTDNLKMARKLGYLDIPDDLMVPLDQALAMKDKEVVLMCTGAQGEPASILGRLSTGTNRMFDLKPGDTVLLSSHPIPGNEEAVYKTINRLFQRGAEVIYEAVAPVHVSGHASQEEMKLLMHLVRPRYFIPIHGELRMLRQHAKLAEDVGILRENIAVVQNGTVIEVSEAGMQIGERLPGGYVFVNGSVVEDMDRSVMRERENLARDGAVSVSAVISGGRVRSVAVQTKGVNLTDEAENGLRTRLYELSGATQAAAEQLIRTYIYNDLRRRPALFVTIHE